MIKLTIQHWIFDKCVDVLFNKLCHNFMPVCSLNGLIEKLSCGDVININTSAYGNRFSGTYLLVNDLDFVIGCSPTNRSYCTLTRSDNIVRMLEYSSDSQLYFKPLNIIDYH